MKRKIEKVDIGFQGFKNALIFLTPDIATYEIWNLSLQGSKKTPHTLAHKVYIYVCTNKGQNVHVHVYNTCPRICAQLFTQLFFAVFLLTYELKFQIS